MLDFYRMAGRKIFSSTAVGVLALMVMCCWSARAQAPLPIYGDHLVNGFHDWGWAPHNYAATSPVRSGSQSISVSFDAGWQGLQIYHPAMNTELFTGIRLWLHGGGGGGQRLQVYGMLNVGGTPNAGQGHFFQLGTLLANQWQQFTIPLSAIGVANKANFTGFVIQDRSGSAQPTFYVDDIELIRAPAPFPIRLGIHTGQRLRGIDERWFGVNTAMWDGNLDTPETVRLLREMGTTTLRCMGGSLSDEYHWAQNRSRNHTWTWQSSFANLLRVATNVGAQVITTVNYGTGTAKEAAAWVAYANGYATNTLPLGVEASGFNWQTVGYWASLRGSTPLSQNDGMNFLRIGRAAPLGFKYWEIGNECYGTWETDSNSVPHDPWTYAQRAHEYMSLMRAVDSTIKIGVVVAPGENSFSNNATHFAVNPRTGTTNYGWTPVTLDTLKTLNAIPDFLVHHFYYQWTDRNNPVGKLSDSLLLQCSTQWAIDASDLRQQLKDYFSPHEENVELLCTENNSDAGAQGKQSTSLVNGLYYADSLGQLMKTEFNGLIWWDLRNSTDTGGWFDPSLYGWRTYGDLGMINGLTNRHPTFYAAKLLRRFVEDRDSIVGTSSDYGLLSAYAARSTNGGLSVLVLNKDTVGTFMSEIQLNGFLPLSSATIMSYGIPQDEAARTNAALAAQDISTNIFAGAKSTFNYSFPPLSLTLFSFQVAPPPTLEVPQQFAHPAGQFIFQLNGQPGASYVVQHSTDLNQWINASTNSLLTSTQLITNMMPAEARQRFWRVVWGK